MTDIVHDIELIAYCANAADDDDHDMSTFDPIDDSGSITATAVIDTLVENEDWEVIDGKLVCPSCVKRAAAAPEPRPTPGYAIHLAKLRQIAAAQNGAGAEGTEL